jgi:hypothetical protein
MNTLIFKTRQVAENAYEVVMYGCYPQVLNTYPTQAKAEEIADKLRGLDL